MPNRLIHLIPEGTPVCERRCGQEIQLYVDRLGVLLRKATKQDPGPEVEGGMCAVEGMPFLKTAAPTYDQFDMLAWVYADAMELDREALLSCQYIVPAVSGVHDQDRGIWLVEEGSPNIVRAVLPIRPDSMFCGLQQCCATLPAWFLSRLQKDDRCFLVVDKVVHRPRMTVTGKQWRGLISMVTKKPPAEFQVNGRTYMTDAFDQQGNFKLKEAPVKIPSLIPQVQVPSPQDTAPVSKPEPAPAAPATPAQEPPRPDDEVKAAAPAAPATVQTVEAEEPTQPAKSQPSKIVRQKKPVMSIGFDFAPVLAYLQSTVDKSEVSLDAVEALNAERRALRDLMMYASRRLFNLDDIMLVEAQQSNAKRSAELEEKLSAISKILK